MMYSFACHECGRTFHRYTRISGPPPTYCSARCRKRAQRRRAQVIANATTSVANATIGLQSAAMTDTPTEPDPVEPDPVEPEPDPEPVVDDDSANKGG
jgi:hypothetical protein